MRELFLLAAITTFGSSLVQSSNPLVKKHIETLQNAKSLKATISVTEVGGTSEDHLLVLAKPNFLKYDSPSIQIIADGTKIYQLDKTKKSYTEVEQTPDWIKSIKNPVIFAWSAMFDNEFEKKIIDPQTGNPRKVRNFAVTEVKAADEKRMPLTFLFDEKLGAFRGGGYMKDDSKFTTVCTELEIGGPEIAPTSFAFDPKGAVKEEPKTEANMTFADMFPAIQRNCLQCHAGAAPGGGIDLSSYQAIAARARNPLFIAGDPESSTLVKVIRSGKMPPGKVMPAGDLDLIVKWIKGGAKP